MGGAVNQCIMKSTYIKQGSPNSMLRAKSYTEYFMKTSIFKRDI